MKGCKTATIRWLLGAIALIGLAGCEVPAEPPPAAVKIGALFPLSGDLRERGLDYVNGMRLATEEINAGGGIAALGGARLAIVLADTQGKPEVGAQETERLIRQEGVVAVIGAFQSSVTTPATQVAERLQTPFIVNGAVADIITERGFRFTFRIQPKARHYAREQVLFLKDLKALAGYPVHRVSLLHENTAFGTSIALAQKATLRAQGMEAVVDIGYRAEGIVDLTAEVAQALALRPDAILTVTYGLDAVLIRRALAASGSTVPMIDTGSGTQIPQYVQALGPLADGTLTVFEYFRFTPREAALNDRFKKRFQTDITGASAHAYQGVLVLKDALERAASTDRQRLREALAATDIPPGPFLVLPDEGLRFDQNGQNEFARVFVVQIQNGQRVPVWPPPYALAKIKIED